MRRRRATHRAPISPLANVGLAVLPLAIVAVAWYGIDTLSERRHRGNLPDGYERLEEGAFEVYYPSGRADVARRIARGGADFMERASRAWRSRLGGLEAPGGSVRLTLFADHDDFERFSSEALSEDLSHNGGYFDALTLEIALVLSEVAQGREDDLDRMGIRHEVAHLMIGRGGGRFGTAMPSWLNEGLATWLETASPDAPDGPAPIAEWVRLVAAVAQPPSVRDLVAARNAAFTSAGNEVYYAYSNLLVHFLVDADAARFWEYAREAREGRAPGSDALYERFGPRASLEQAWSRFVSGLRGRFARDLGQRSERRLD